MVARHGLHDTRDIFGCPFRQIRPGLPKSGEGILETADPRGKFNALTSNIKIGLRGKLDLRNHIHRKLLDNIRRYRGVLVVKYNNLHIRIFFAQAFRDLEKRLPEFAGAASGIKLIPIFGLHAEQLVTVFAVALAKAIAVNTAYRNRLCSVCNHFFRFRIYKILRTS